MKEIEFNYISFGEDEHEKINRLIKKIRDEGYEGKITVEHNSKRISFGSDYDDGRTDKFIAIFWAIATPILIGVVIALKLLGK